MNGEPDAAPEQKGEARELADGELLLDFPAGAVARLTLNNPDKRNPLTHRVLDALAETLPLLDHGIDVRCILITGSGTAFSAGYDIGAIPDESFARDAEALVAHPFTAAMDAVSAHPFPVVAALNGHCLGGGLELAVRCDMRLCAAEAKLGMPPAKLGLIYGHTGLERFIDCIGVPRTKELFLTGRVIGGERAERIGLVHEVHPAAEIEAESLELASADRRQRTALDPRQQASDRDPLSIPATEPERGRGAGRPARVVLRLRGLPRGHPRVRREAGPGVEGALGPMGPPHEELAAADPRLARLIDEIDAGVDPQASLRPDRGPVRGPGPDHRRPAGVDRGGADDLGPDHRGLRRGPDPDPADRRRRRADGSGPAASAGGRPPT